MTTGARQSKSKKWRDQQLADLDRFLDRIQQTFDAGEATESYRKATDLLAAKGADEALAYLQARGNQRKSQIEMQANRRDQEEAGLRNLLQEELLAASLLETKFRFDDAEAKYRQVLEKSGSWPKARNDFTWFLITAEKSSILLWEMRSCRRHWSFVAGPLLLHRDKPRRRTGP